MFTERAFFSHISDMITTLLGYISYYISTARYDEGIRAAEWAIRFLESLKADPARPAYLDKIISLLYLDRAVLQDGKGMPEASEESLRTAVGIAAVFDGDPVSTMENVILLRNAEKQGVYDDSGPTATDGLKRSLEETSPFVSEAFRKKFDREIETAKQHGSPVHSSS